MYIKHPVRVTLKKVMHMPLRNNYYLCQRGHLFWIVIWICTNMKWFVASETFHPSKMS